MDRNEYVAWCKERALETLKGGNVRGAVLGMINDLSKEQSTQQTPAIVLVAATNITSEEDARKFIEGFR